MEHLRRRRRHSPSRRFVDEDSDLDLEERDLALALLSFGALEPFAPVTPPPLVIKASRGKGGDEERISG